MRLVRKTDEKKALSVVRYLALGYFIVILTGSILLTLPIASQKNVWTPFIDALFTATSAVCVTGLVVVDTGTHWSFFGQVVIISLIQIGGLGFVTFSTLIFIILGKKITLRQRLIMQQGINGFDLKGVVRLTRAIVLMTLAVELIGGLVLATQFIPEYGLLKGAWFGIFHAISAFCNAGFDLIGDFNSLIAYQNNPVILYTIMILIVTGGLGFFVWRDIWYLKKEKKLSFHSKLVLSMTGVLIVVGAVFIGINEFFNTETIGNLSYINRFNNILFLAITPRTAGFTTVNLTHLAFPTAIFTIMLMFIGASPGSTGGGIKTTTLATIFLTIYSVAKGKEEANIFGRKISQDTVLRSCVIFIVGIILVSGFSLILSMTDGKNGMLAILFEVVSAFGTVGSSLNMSPNMTTVGKILISIMMFIGRVGPLTLGLALVSQQRRSKMSYAEGRILIG